MRWQRWLAVLWSVWAILGVVVACGGEGGGPSGPDPEESSLLSLALAEGLLPMPLEPPRPEENPYFQPKIELGHLLFFDPILSGPRDLACSTCHLPRFAFADARQFPSGAGASGLGPDRTIPAPPPLRAMERNSPPTLNMGLFGRNDPVPSTNGMMFWSGTAFGIEDQTLNPISADKELRGLTYSKVVAIDSVLVRLRGIPEYLDLFATAFPEITSVHGMDPNRLINSNTLRRALAAYVRELITPNAPIDDFLKGDETALSLNQKAGLELFIGKAGCVDCHTGPLFSDFKRHVIGAKQEGMGRDTTPGDDLGWGEVGGVPYAFRTAQLRQVELTSPYFHAGTAATLEEVLLFKNRGESDHAKVSQAMLDPLVKPLNLTDEEIQLLIRFMEALTDRTSVLLPLFQPPARVPSGLEVPK
jgi:cytochrome c peroxidase